VEQSGSSSGLKHFLNAQGCIQGNLYMITFQIRGILLNGNPEPNPIKK